MFPNGILRTREGNGRSTIYDAALLSIGDETYLRLYERVLTVLWRI